MLVGPGFYNRYVKLPEDIVPSAIHDNPKLWPYFHNCHGTIDGVHFYVHVLVELMASCPNRKGFLSQNVLAGSTFDLFFCYILSGWEGSAADGHLFEDAQRKDFAVPLGKYYLADAGFPHCDVLLIPYCGVRYHLKEWAQAAIWFVFSQLIVLSL
jgi:hypothetical protein